MIGWALRRGYGYLRLQSATKRKAHTRKDYDRGRGVCPTRLARGKDCDYVTVFATANTSASVLIYYHALSFFGRSANVTASFPYGVGAYRGHVIVGEPTHIDLGCSTRFIASP
jgi:hypothetical protein